MIRENDGQDTWKWKKNLKNILLSTKHLCCWIPTLLLDKNPQIHKFSAKLKPASRGLYLASSLKDSSDRFAKANNKDSPFIGKLTLQENPSKLMHQQSWRKSRVAQILLTSFCNNYSSNLMAATESPSCSSEKDLHTSNYRPTWLNKTKTCKKTIYRQEEQQNLPVIYLFLMYFLMLVSSLNLPNPHKNRLLPDVKWGLRNPTWLSCNDTTISSQSVVQTGQNTGSRTVPSGQWGWGCPVAWEGGYLLFEYELKCATTPQSHEYVLFGFQYRCTLHTCI